MKSLIHTCFILLLVSAPTVLACSVPPDGIWRPHLQVLKEANYVALVELLSAESADNLISYQFKVLENIKGEPREAYEIVLEGDLPGSTIDMGGHTNFQFWTRSAGGSKYTSFCSVRPSFQILYQYLIVEVDSVSHLSYEMIWDENDRWLNFVRNTASEGHTMVPVLSPSELLTQFSSIHIYDCPGLSRPMKSVPHLTSSIRGSVPENPPFPRKADGFSCSVEKSFAYLGTNIDYERLLIPIRNGQLDFNEIARGLELVPDNVLSIGELAKGQGKERGKERRHP